MSVIIGREFRFNVEGGAYVEVMNVDLGCIKYLEEIWDNERDEEVWG